MTMGSKPESYVKEFTRHSTDMMLNLNEMRKREILTDVKVLVDGEEFKAHKAVLIACSGFFYSIFSDQTKRNVSLLTLPCGVSASGFRLLLEFMYTSCLPLDPGSVAEVLTAASYLQMDHVAETCRSFACFSVPQLHTYLKSLDYPLGRALAYSRGSEDPGLHFVPSRALLPTCAPHLLVAGGPGYLPESALRFPGGRVAPRGSRQDVPGEEVGGRRCGGGWAGSRPGSRPETRPPRGGKQPEERAPVDRPATLGQSRNKTPVLTPDSPLCSDCQPDSPTESRSAALGSHRPAQESQAPDPKACNWKKYKFIVLNSLSQQGTKGPRSPEPLYSRSADATQGGNNNSGSSSDESSTNMEEETEDEDPACKKSAHRSSSESPASRTSSACSLCELHSDLCRHALVSHPSEEMPGYHSEFSDSGSENGLFSCTTCDLKLSDEELLQQHFLRVHSDDKPYKCDMCQAAFRYKGNLTSHRTVHTGEKPYRCTVCGAQFNRPANLKTHTRIHSGEKPYKCETCGARFVQVAHLRAHVLIHTGEKPYPCETCGTRFRHLQTLKSHIRIHTGEKPYHCEKCDLHFRHKSQLRLHLRQKHGAITNTKIRYKIVPELYVSGHQAC
ncbi:B-cell lymphoma 6 protein homolog [Rhincodon typus]|uniref:B-cell lymphoma 6 protein homolog n=1 Tax=Rhincodon typus TaxID=259920 RepID=UPI00202EC8F2|nr:B-cell lymphoma 6 protein homolog [Rhincodon typus]XP_048476201.1 B-cell lymphoma 6 protein homolog [Rhincodon typus]XP_048476202.1 B-cell lymphoma 6 protein homolog [Rhincodon typus]